MSVAARETTRSRTTAAGTVAAVARNGVHAFSKPACDEIMLVAGLGVAGDVHAGVTVRHRSRVAADPTQPNLRQVHLMHRELFDEVAAEGYAVAPGQLGENITTGGLDLLGLPCGAVLRFGPPPDTGAVTGAAPSGSAGAAWAGTASARDAAGMDALGPGMAEPHAAGPGVAGPGVAGPGVPDPRPAVVVTGLRNPCRQIDGFRKGLLKLVVHRDADGRLIRRAGVMGVVLRGGPVRPGDLVTVELPPGPHVPLDRV